MGQSKALEAACCGASCGGLWRESPAPFLLGRQKLACDDCVVWLPTVYLQFLPWVVQQYKTGCNFDIRCLDLFWIFQADPATRVHLVQCMKTDCSLLYLRGSDKKVRQSLEAWSCIKPSCSKRKQKTPKLEFESISSCLSSTNGRSNKVR